MTKNAGVGSDDQHLSDAREARRSEQGHVRPLRLPRVGFGSWQEVPGTLLGVRDGGAGGVRGTSSRPPGSAKHKGPRKLETGSFYLLGCLEVVFSETPICPVKFLCVRSGATRTLSKALFCVCLQPTCVVSI